jgi:predicted small metal-binding protein
MAQRIYKQLSCREVGADCDFLVRSENEDEVISLASEHACRSHNICEITPELKAKMQSSIKSVWCEGSCRDTPWIGRLAFFGSHL